MAWIHEAIYNSRLQLKSDRYLEITVARKWGYGLENQYRLRKNIS